MFMVKFAKSFAKIVLIDLMLMYSLKFKVPSVESSKITELRQYHAV